MNETNENRDFDNLLEHIKRTRGFDFTGYKRASLLRRVSKRVQEVGIRTFSKYQDYLEAQLSQGAATLDYLRPPRPGTGSAHLPH